MQSNTQNTEIDLVLEIRPWTFMQSRRSDIHFYYHAVENVPMMFDEIESLSVKIDGKRLGMVRYSDNQKKEFTQLTGVYMDELMLKMQLFQYLRKTTTYPFEVENEEILSNILRDIFAKDLKRMDEYNERSRLLKTWFDQEKEFFISHTGLLSVTNSEHFHHYLTIEKNIKLDELIDFDEIYDSSERVIELMGTFYAAEKDKRTNSMNPTQNTPPQPAEEQKPKVPGSNCTEFDDLFGENIKGKNELWGYMIDLKMIDINGKYLMGSNVSFIKSFVVIMKKYFKLPNQSDTKLVNVLTLKILGKSKRIHKSNREDECQIEGFLNGI